MLALKIYLDGMASCENVDAHLRNGVSDVMLVLTPQSSNTWKVGKVLFPRRFCSLKNLLENRQSCCFNYLFIQRQMRKKFKVFTNCSWEN